MDKKIYLLGVVHATDYAGFKKQSLVHPHITSEIIHDFGDILKSEKTLVIAEDALISQKTHDCKCGTVKVEHENRISVLKSIFNEQHNAFLQQIQASIVIADKRGLKNSLFQEYINKLTHIIKNKYFSIKNFKSKNPNTHDLNELFQYLFIKKRISVQKEKIREVFADFLSQGVEDFCNTINHEIKHGCEDVIINSLEYHLQNKCQVCNFETIVIITGAYHAKNIHFQQRIMTEYVYQDYAFSPEERIKESFKEEVFNNITKEEAFMNILLLPNKVFWDHVMS